MNDLDVRRNNFPVNRNQTSIPVALQDAKESLTRFQVGVEAKIYSSQFLAAATSSIFRREYLEYLGDHPFYFGSSMHARGGKIAWLKLETVGIDHDSPINYTTALEKMFQAFHVPNRYEIIFLVTSDGSTASIYLGLRHYEESNSSVAELMNNFSKSVWPGCSFKREKSAPEIFEELLQRKRSLGHEGSFYYDSEIRAISGIPAFRNDQSNLKLDTIDQLVATLPGKKWAYMVIADPVANSEMDAIISQCRDFAGRAESMKTFQIGKNFTEAFSKAYSETYGESYSKTTGTNQSAAGPVRQVAATAVNLLPFALLATGAICPALLPALIPAKILGAVSFISAKGLGTAAAIAGGMAVNGLAQCLRGNKTKSESDTEGKSWQQSVSETVTETNGVSMGQTIVNKHADMLAKLLEAHEQRFALCEALGAWEVGTYFIGEDKLTANTGSNVLRSLQSGENSSYEPIRIHKIVKSNSVFKETYDPCLKLKSFEKPDIYQTREDNSENGNRIAHPLGRRFDGIHTLLNSREMTHLINFPLNNVAGVSVRNVTPSTGLAPHTFNDEAHFNLGKQMYRGDVVESMDFNLPLRSLAKHVLVAGINGSGKTTTIKKMLSGMGNYPFMVIEPAKTEYVDWAVENNNAILAACSNDIQKARENKNWIDIYMPGRTNWRDYQTELDQLSLNPFDFVWLKEQTVPHVLEHIDSLKTIINAALPMQEILPVLLEELIYKVYSIKAINPEGKVAAWLPSGGHVVLRNHEDERPTFVQMCMHIDGIVDSRGYEPRIANNLKAALKTRIMSFMRGWRDSVFNCAISDSEKWEKFFNRRTVINLTSLSSDDDKAFFMAIILLALYEYRQACDEIRHDESFKSLLVLEEAHRILSKAHPAVEGTANPQSKVSTMFSHILSELRAYGQGVLIADQIPSRLNEDAIKNTNLKVVHKLVAADDRDAMATALNLRPEQTYLIGDLSVGEVIVRGDMDKEAFYVKIKASV